MVFLICQLKKILNFFVFCFVFLKDVHKKIEELKGYLPTYQDLKGAVTALLRLQDTYKLDTNHLAQGRIRSMMANSMSGMTTQYFPQRESLEIQNLNLTLVSQSFDGMKLNISDFKTI